MSAAAAATATISVWVPVIATSIGAAVALIASVLTQLWSGRQLRRQWDRERVDRQQQDRQQVYARLIAALYQWDDVLEQAAKVPEDDTERWEKQKEAHYAAGNAAAEALPLVEFMAPPPIREQAIKAVKDRYGYWRLRLLRSPKRREQPDIHKRDRDWKDLLAGKSALLDAMRSDTNIEKPETRAEPAQSADG